VESPTWRLYFEIAYVLRVRVSEVMSWPLWEVLAWQSLFDVVGPLDWTREDMRDARRHAFKYGRVGDTIDSGRLFQPAQKRKTEREEYIENLENAIVTAAALGGPEAVKALRKKLKAAKQEQFRF